MAVAVGVASSGAARASTAPTGNADPAAVLRYGTSLDATGSGGGPITLDPATQSGSPLNTGINELIYDNLIRKGPSGEPVAGLATSWDFVDDSTIELNLRKGVKFQDGTDLDANAVTFSLERTLRAGSPVLGAFTALDSAEVVSPLVVRLHLKSPTIATFFPLLQSAQAFVVSPTAVAKEGSAFADHPVGAGPYRVEGFVPEQRVSLRKFSDFWDRTGWRLHGIDFIQAEAGPPAINALRANQVDMIYVSDASQASQVRSLSDIHLTSKASNTAMMLLGMCLTTKPLDKLDVRKAIAYAINRNELNQATTEGEGTVTDLPWPKDSVFYARDVGGRYPYNPKKSKQLLARAGLPHGFAFDLLYPAPSFAPAAEVLQAQLAKVGITMNVRQAANYVQQVLQDNQAPTTLSQTVRGGLGKISYIDPISGSIGNWCHYTNPKLASAVETLQKSVGLDVEKGQWRSIEQVVMDDVPILYLFSLPVTVAYTNGVHGVKDIYDAAGEGPNFQTIYMSK
jgi:ABC-type transport system substrate-binding protein